MHLKSDWFEKLKQADGLYAIKFNKSQSNIRILFTFIEIECNRLRYALLLCAFEEKDHKNMSQYSYSKYIPLAQKRLKEVINDD